MSIESIIIYGIALILVIISAFKDIEKTKKGIKKGVKSFLKVMPVLLPLFLFIGILLAIVTPEFISRFLGEDSGLMGYIIGLTVGSITFMPPFVAYPLGVELLNNGAAYPQVAGLLVTLMSVGIVYYAAESKFFSKKAAIFRNLISFIGAILVILIVLVVY
ncbi:permease [Candidatus Izimaplasma bacterium]|nr:permease [Candidatus Izimaplasma bacterium]